MLACRSGGVNLPFHARFGINPASGCAYLVVAVSTIEAAPATGTENPFPVNSLLVDSSALTSLLSFHRTGTNAPVASQPPTIATAHHTMTILFRNRESGFLPSAALLYNHYFSVI
jgi:hypothetical protein